jgi:hypothetical protein
MAEPSELDVPCLDCEHNATMPGAALLPPLCGRDAVSGGVGQVPLFGLWVKAG